MIQKPRGFRGIPATLKTLMGVIVSAAVLSFVPAAHAAGEATAGMPGEMKDAPGPAPVNLKLDEAIQMALKGNLDIQISRLTPEQRKQDLISAQAAFDPEAFANLNHEEQNQPSTTRFAAATQVQDQFDAGVRTNVITGGSAQLSFNNFRNSADNPFNLFKTSYSSSLALSFSQPLLRKFGLRHSRNGILIARNNLDASLSEFRASVMTTVRRASDAYWDLVAAIRNHDADRESFDLARDLLKLNKAKVDVGTLAPIEITQAEAGVASRDQSVIVSENEIRRAEDNLRQILHVQKGSDLWLKPISPTDEPPFAVVNPNMESEVVDALAKRPELEQRRLDQKTLELNRDFTHNRLLPQLDVNGSINYAGTAGDFGNPIDTNGDGTIDVIKQINQGFGEAWNQIVDRENRSWGAGLTFSIPIFNRDAKATYARSRIAVDQGQLGIANLEQQIEIEVRNAVRNVQTNIRRVQAARVNLDLQQKKVEAEQKRLQYGMTTTYDVLNFQNDLTLAKVSLTQSIIDYNKSLTALDEATGKLLEKQGIEAK